jgi:hypothetical protein
MATTKEKKKETLTRPITKEELEMTAYFRWLDRGCPADDPMTDWIEAEKKLLRATREKSGKEN